MPMFRYDNSGCAAVSDYYLFGMPMPSRTFTGNGYRYGFNGKELDQEGVGGGGATYDYGFRIYNPQIGRFLSVDPLFESYPFYTPYQFAGNKPIAAIDLDGLEELVVVRWFEGDKYIGETAFRVPVDLRDNNHNGGGDMLVINRQLIPLTASASNRSRFHSRLSRVFDSYTRIQYLRQSNSEVKKNGKFDAGGTNGEIYMPTMSNFYKKLNQHITTNEASREVGDGDFSWLWAKEFRIEFQDPNNTDPSKYSSVEMTNIKNQLREFPGVDIEITAYASTGDRTGVSEEEANELDQELAIQRGENIKKILIDFGIPADRIKINVENTRPKDGENKAANRSADVVLVKE
jgi:RHS repeat-associated protein